MHDCTIFPEVRERIIEKRGRLHLYDRLDPARTALVVVDMQNAFVAPDGVLEVSEARDVVPNINRLAAGVRAVGGTVVWAISSYSDQSLEDWSILLGGMMPTSVAQSFVDSMKPGADGHRIFAELETERGDLRVEKDRFSAFLPGASGIERLLRDHGIDTIAIAGTVTQVCCESTARDAMQSNFKVIMVADCNASYSELLHRASLSIFAMSFGDVMTTDEVLDRLRRTSE